MKQSKIWCFSVCFLFLVSCGSPRGQKPGWENSGSVIAGIYPKHNEGLLNHYGGITDARIDITTDVRYGRYGLILRPSVLAGGDWPHDDRPTRFGNHPQWIYLDLGYGLELRLNAARAKGNWYAGYLKERTWELWHDQTGVTQCNCTYSNLWYLKYTWGD